MTMRSICRSAAYSIMRSAIGSTPVCALMTIAAVSTASSAGSAWPMKSAAPGVSMKCTRVPSWRRCMTVAFSEWPMRFSSGSWSLTVLPRSSVPADVIAPACSSKASARLVLPAAAGPTSASVRIVVMASAAARSLPLGLGLDMSRSPSAQVRGVCGGGLGKRALTNGRPDFNPPRVEAVGAGDALLLCPMPRVRATRSRRRLTEIRSMPTKEIPLLSATALSAAVQQRQVSCREVMQAYLARIEVLNPKVNALVGLLPIEPLLQQADAYDVMLARGESMGWMHGFPMAIKDLSPVAGLPLSKGSQILADYVPRHDSLMVARMKAAGGIVIGKTNVPEFGLGSHSYNPVFGVTGNAWDPSRSAGGSSGGAAVSLALRLQPVADGSDMMGSLRNPAAWANVFGLRPSFGRVPYEARDSDAFVAQLGVEGPMARNVRDLAMLLSVQAGYDARQPLSIAEDGSAFARPLKADAKGLRIGWLGDLDGYLPFEPGIVELCASALQRFESLGAVVEPMSLGYPCDEVWQTWLTWRRFLVSGSLAAFGADAQHRARLKPEALWEYEQGIGLSGPLVYEASLKRTRFYRHLVRLFERYDLLVLPSAQVWPFPAEWTWPREVAGRTMDTYHRWMEVVIYATLAGLPAMSVPVGFSGAGLPMGMQLIGRPRGDLALIEAAAAYELSIGDLLSRRPALG